ncbi:MAG: LacI family DNA-binding transcriptional regulator [Spirochaetales bacterium]|nr:LacI family DNA-binding transcriptional regulator [Spirochaetales bacterium]
MITIKDVAREANVSPTTVSQVVNGNRPTSESAKIRVQEAIKKLGYIPNENARSLNMKNTHTIGILTDEESDFLFAEILGGIESVSYAKQYHILLLSIKQFGGNFEKAMNFLYRKRIEGIIYVSSFTSDKNLSLMSKIEIPFIFANCPGSENSDSVIPNNYEGGRIAALHLIEKGCNNFAMIAGPEDRPSSNDRKRGYIDELVSNNKNINDDLIFHGEMDYNTGYNATKQFISSKKKFDALFCANDLIAAGALNAISETRLKCPKDIKIVGYDNKEFCEIWPTPITSIQSPLTDLGEQAGKILFERIEKRQEKSTEQEKFTPQQALIMPRLIERVTTNK